MSQSTENWSFKTTRIGRHVQVFEELASTNTTAAQLATREKSDGLVIMANHQTTGRGQYGRVWESRPGSSLLMSVILKPPIELRRATVLTAFAAVAVSNAIMALTGRVALIKWPNDLLIHNKKVCGILIEQHGSVAIIGIGLNLNQTTEEFAEATLPDATSLAVVFGEQFAIRTVAEAVLQQLDKLYHSLLTGDRRQIEFFWKMRFGLLGEEVAIELMDGSIVAGKLQEMDFEKLELERSEGMLQTIVPETVRHIRKL